MLRECPSKAHRHERIKHLRLDPRVTHLYQYRPLMVANAKEAPLRAIGSTGGLSEWRGGGGGVAAGGIGGGGAIDRVAIDVCVKTRRVVQGEKKRWGKNGGG